MLTKIKLKNFKSFKNETIIDVTSTNYKMLAQTNEVKGILKGLLFVGGNGTGKTNSIASIRFLLELLFLNESINVTEYFCLFSSSKEMELEYSFKFDQDEITYGFIFGIDGKVNKEYLTQNSIQLFNRIGTNAESSITDTKYYDKTSIDSETLFIKNIYFNTKFVGFPTLQKCWDFLYNSIYINAVTTTVKSYNKNNNINLINYLEKEGVIEINDFFSHFGFNQEICYENEHFISKNSYAKVDKSKEVFLKRNNLDIWMPLTIESMGNITLLNILPAVLFAIKHDCILIFDEFSSAFHNELEELIIRYFMYKSGNSQIFIVSHSTNLLSSTLLRPDQIYTTNFKNEDGTFLKRFSSEKPRESQNFEKMYLNGVFDGIPNYQNATNNN